MEYRLLGNTDIKVSLICLGTMTWGKQNTQDQAFSQLNYAIEQGINFIDTAEMYAVPPSAETYGKTETIIGNWLQKTGKRKDIVLATKIAGPSMFASHIRDGGTRFNLENLELAVNDSLKRLQTDYIDLYQLHWPERSTNYFGKLAFKNIEEEDATPIHETLEALAAIAKSGKVKYFGLSNETAWGAMEFIKIAERYNLPRMVSIQNPYSLLNRSFEVGLSEVALREKAGLLAYSPLAFGVLSGKYLNGRQPSAARLTLFPTYARYTSEIGIAATAEYVELANQHGLRPAQMALSFVNQQQFVTSNIIGATNMEQLQENIDSVNVKLSAEVMEKIEGIGKKYTYPCP